VAALIAWSLVVMAWMIVTRFGALKRRRISLKGMVGARGNALEGVVEDRVQWKSHNYSHLMEQPTCFYAIALTLAILGQGGSWNLWLAWGYVAFRVAHSLVQVTVNLVQWRFLLFAAASLCLAGLTLHAAMTLLHAHG
jgi:hypothetical protein